MMRHGISAFLADFGLSINFEQERPVTRVGTLDYMAPEVVVCPDKHKPNDNKEIIRAYLTLLICEYVYRYSCEKDKTLDKHKSHAYLLNYPQKFESSKEALKYMID